MNPQGCDVLAVDALRLEAAEPHHLRLAGPIDIGIQ